MVSKKGRLFIYYVLLIFCPENDPIRLVLNQVWVNIDSSIFSFIKAEKEKNALVNKLKKNTGNVVEELVK